jgi:hypothetical protein
MRENDIYAGERHLWGNNIYVRPAIYEAKSTFVGDAGDLPRGKVIYGENVIYESSPAPATRSEPVAPGEHGRQQRADHDDNNPH